MYLFMFNIMWVEMSPNLLEYHGRGKLCQKNISDNYDKYLHT